MKGSEALIEHAQSRTKEVRARVKSALREMEADIEKHEGLYPYNGGRLTFAEVCRRAGVHKVTLQGKEHKTTTREDIRSWLATTKAKLITGSKVVRSTVAKRADDWRERYLDVAHQFNLFKIEAIAKDERIADLEAELLMLRAEASTGKVVPMTRTRTKVD